MSLNYYCYYCQCRVKVIPRPLPTCTQCLQQFVEEVASSSQNTDIDDNVQNNEFYDSIATSDVENEEDEEENILWYQAESDDNDIMFSTNSSRNIENYPYEHLLYSNTRQRQEETNDIDSFQQRQLINEWFLQEYHDDEDDDDYETQIVQNVEEHEQVNEDEDEINIIDDNDDDDDEEGEEHDHDDEEQDDDDDTYNEYLTAYALLASNRHQQRQHQSSNRTNNGLLSSSSFLHIERLLNVIYQGFYESDNEIDDDGEHQGFLGNLMEMFNDPEDSPHHPSDENIDSWINQLDKRYFEQECLDVKTECIICQENFGTFNELIKMPCQHEYHGTCLRQWLHVNATCPICRCPASSILEKRNTLTELQSREEPSSSSLNRSTTSFYSTTSLDRTEQNDMSFELLENNNDHILQQGDNSNNNNNEEEEEDDNDDFYEVNESIYHLINTTSLT
ncbi:hypothetical protein BJ944DRAFT_263330 [Cunninghamella echinulata]|nr:hypothetical protein BJ944DRAFT_263330 [Cunninghamella echinulata]